MGEFGVQAENAEDEKDKENIRLDDAGEKFLTRGQLEGYAHGIGERELDFGAVEASDLAAIELAEKVVLGIGDEIDELAFEGLFFGKSFGVGDRRFRQRGIAATLFGKAAQEGLSIVGDFAA